MSDVFISYARSTKAQAQQIAGGLRALGYDVWQDDLIPAHRAYGQVIEEHLAAARAVVVVWSPDATRSEWVRSEASRARAAGKLVQLTVDKTPLPMPFDQIECANLVGWSGDPGAAGWRKVLASIGHLTGRSGVAPVEPARVVAGRPSICVLPFANMSGDAEQEYFSDGVSEDIITDLAKVSALSVVARNTAFTFKGRSVDAPSLARQLNVGHVLAGSVRKSGNRVRISAQLIDGRAGDTVWAERWDRDLVDIFALQDEISQAVVGALKLKLLPEERAAMARRGTANPEAYTLYLQARQLHVSGNQGDPRREARVIRLCRQATEIDPDYAAAWALMALAQTWLAFTHGVEGDDGWAAAERALSLDPDLAEAHAVRARRLAEHGREDEAFAEVERALALDGDSYEANMTAARLKFRKGLIEDAIRYYEQAASTQMEADFGCSGMLITCYTAVGDREGARRAAVATLARAEQVLVDEPANGAAMGFGAGALAVLGEAERAREWIARALRTDPDNLNMRYNLACALSVHLRDVEGALELLGSYFARVTPGWLSNAKVDPDLEPVRRDPRFEDMVRAAEARLAATDIAQ
jgi:adenylate cyclase